MSRALEKWLGDGLDAQVVEDNKRREADAARAAVAAAKEEEAAAAFGALIAGDVGQSAPDDDGADDTA